MAFNARRAVVGAGIGAVIGFIGVMSGEPLVWVAVPILAMILGFEGEATGTGDASSPTWSGSSGGDSPGSSDSGGGGGDGG